MIRVCVCGGRGYTDEGKVEEVLTQLLCIRKDFCIISGGAKGADTLAAIWAVTRRVPLEVFPADWETHGKLMGKAQDL